jgi:hypothetical protein
MVDVDVDGSVVGDTVDDVLDGEAVDDELEVLAGWVLEVGVTDVVVELVELLVGEVDVEVLVLVVG